MHYLLVHATETITAADMILLAEAMRDAWFSEFMQVMNENWIHETCTLVLSKGDGTIVEGSSSNPTVGQDSGAPCDASTCVVVSWRVGSTWRGGKPRSYIPGVSQDRLDNPALFTSETVSDYQSASDGYLEVVNMLTPGPFDSVTLGTFRRFGTVGGVPGTVFDPPHWVPYLSSLVRQVPGSQRRRLRS